MTIRPRFLPPPRPALLLAGLLLAAGGSGCSYFHTLGSGTHMVQTKAPPAPLDRRVRVMVVEVTTGPQGEIANIRFQRSSGKDGVDGYVAQTIRDGWPPQPSVRTVVEVTYSEEKGFSQPKVISTAPAT